METDKNKDLEISGSEAAAYMIGVVFILAPIWIYSKGDIFEFAEREKIISAFTLVGALAGFVCGWLFAARRKLLASVCGSLSALTLITLFAYLSFYVKFKIGQSIITMITIAAAGMVGVTVNFIASSLLYGDDP